MLFDNVSRRRRSAAVQQQHLMFLDIPCPHEAVWTQLNDEQREAVVETLARLIGQTAMAQAPREENNDD
jgi:hypothetical protein